MTQAPPTLTHDIPCIACGYNLRGLGPRGSCPECGAMVVPSVVAWKERQQQAIILRRGDPRWLRQLIEGLWVALLSFALMLLLACAPDWAFVWKSPQRRWTLGLASCAYVLSCAAAWKLTARPGDEISRKHGARRALRIGIVFHLGLPFIVGLMPRYNASIAWVVPALASMLGGCVAAVAWYVYLARLARGVGAWVMVVEARVLTVCAVLLFVLALLPELDGAEDSLSMLFRLDMIPFGTMEILSEVCREAKRGSMPHPIFLAAVAVPLWSVAVVVRLLILLIMVRRKRWKQAMGAIGGRTPASSPP